MMRIRLTFTIVNKIYSMNEKICANANSIKVILTLMVIYIHSFSLVPSVDGTLLWDVKVYLSFILPRIAVPMFFLYSGFFFFKGNLLTIKAWCKKLITRIYSVFIPFLLWSIVGGMFFFLLDGTLCMESWDASNIINRVLWQNSYTPVVDYPQWIGYEIPKITPLNLPLWYVRDLLLLIVITPLLYNLLRYKWLSVLTLTILLGAFLFVDTNRLPYIGIDNLLFFYVGAFLSYNSFNIKLSCIAFDLLIIFAISMSFCAYVFYGTAFETYSRHLYIMVTVFTLLNFPVMKKCNNMMTRLNIGGGMFFVFCSHIMVLRLLAIVTYRLSMILSFGGNMILYLTVPLVCFAICVALYGLMEKTVPTLLTILVGNRITKQK